MPAFPLFNVNNSFNSFFLCKMKNRGAQNTIDVTKYHSMDTKH